MKMTFDDYDKLEAKAKELVAKRANFNWFPTQEAAENMVLNLSLYNLKLLMLADSVPAEKLNEKQKKVQSYIRASLRDELDLVEVVPREEPLEIKRSKLNEYARNISMLDFQLGKDQNYWFPTMEELMEKEIGFDEQYVMFLMWVLNGYKNEMREKLTPEQDEARVYIQEFLQDPDYIKIIEDLKDGK